MVPTAAAGTGAIEVRSLTKRFGGVTAVRDLSFTVEPGRVTGFLGPNGAGKTTTLRVLLDLVRATSGTATIGGRRYRELAEPARHVGAVLEATSFHPARRAGAHLEMMAIAAGIDRGRVPRVLELVGLTGQSRRKVGGYSLGMRQRLQLAGALLGDPEVLVLDEPSNGLDPQGIAWLRELLRYLAGEGRTVLVSSHLLAEMAQTVDDVVIVSHGVLRAQGPLSVLTARTRTSMRVRTPEPDRLSSVAERAGYAPRPSQPGVVTIDGATPEQLGPLLAAERVVIYEMTHHRQDLESLFLEMTAAPGGDGAPGGEPPRRPVGPPSGPAASAGPPPPAPTPSPWTVTAGDRPAGGPR
ncbi:MAG: ABC transporter ATP-binding protein [Acidimicrobiales bacterium]